MLDILPPTRYGLLPRGREEEKYDRARITKSYPVVWLGENGCRLSGFGKLIEVEISSQVFSLLLNTASLKEAEQFKLLGQTCIVAGGIAPPAIFKVKAILRGNRETISDIVHWFRAVYRDENIYALIPSGAKDWSFYLLVEECRVEFEELSSSCIANVYPYKFDIDIESKTIKIMENCN